MPLDSLQALSDELADIVAKTSMAVARVEGRDRVPGSGIVWSTDGVILTADHILEREENISVVVAGSSHQAQLIGRDPTTDIAALRIKGGNLVAAKVADSKTLKPGHLVVAIGRPWGDEPMVSGGIVSSVSRSGNGPGWASQFREGLIQADLILYPGFSGGPLVDASGRVVGINSSAIGRGVSLAIPTETATRVMADLVKEGRVKRGYFGVGVQKVPLADSLKQKLGLSQETGLMIMTIESGSAAEKGNLLPGDILVGVDGATLARVRELHAWLSSQNAGHNAQAKVVRGGELQSVPITVGSR